MNKFDIIDNLYKQEQKARAKANWDKIPQGNHKCKVYFKLKNGKSLLDSNYFGTKILTKKDVEFLNGKTTKSNIFKKLEMVQTAEDTTVNYGKLEQRYFEDVTDNEKMLNYIINQLRSCEKADGYVNISKYVNFKIIVKIVE